MRQNDSPWLAQLERKHEVNPLNDNRETEVAIIGAGIAGISTAFFLLKYTDKKVFVIEADRVAHGATGHNAGQVVSYSERQLSDLVKEFGIEKTAHTQRSIYGAWELVDEMFKDGNLQVPLAKFIGHAGCQDLEEVLVHLENNRYAKATKVKMEPLMVAEESLVATQIPSKYKGLYDLVPHQQILETLQTNDTKYIAALSGQKGVMNSAVFCEEILAYLFHTYPDRFSLFEESPVDELNLYDDYAILKIRTNEVKTQKVVLCTNGFEKFVINNKVGDNIDTKFHHFIHGTVGYMAAYLEMENKSPIAISYLPSHSHTGNKEFDYNPYFYLTRRDYKNDGGQKSSLVCIGGPESKMEDTHRYSREHPYPSEAQQAIDEFLHKTYKYAPSGQIEYKYRWHGLMGYTTNGVRLVGPEPINPILLYNLGCNGVGILPSIFGGKRISQFVNGEQLEESIFDPQDHRRNK